MKNIRKVEEYHRSLNNDDIQQIVSLELDKMATRLADSNIHLSATPETLSLLADQGYDAEMGARPLKRVIQQRAEDKVSDAVLSGTFVDGDHVLVDVDSEGEIILTRVPAPEPEPTA